jgi:heterodisulfide reductase subunit C
VPGLCSFQCYNIPTNFCENLVTCSKVESRDIHIDNVLISLTYFVHRKGMQAKKYSFTMDMVYKNGP